MAAGDAAALDAALMQFAAVIVSTTGAEVDRLERQIMVRGLIVWFVCVRVCVCPVGRRAVAVVV